MARDRRGRQHAWVVWAAAGFAEGRLPLTLRRLSDLNGRRGPRVGREAILARAGSGHARPDIAFERTGGRWRGAVVWLDRLGDGSFSLTVGWITVLSTNTPQLRARRVLLSSRRGTATGTLVSTPAGMRVVATTPEGELVVFSHPNGAPLSTWRRGRGAVTVARKSKPSAIAHGRRILASGVLRRGSIVKVISYRRNGTGARSALRVRGYADPILTEARGRPVVIMIRKRDRRVVSRTLTSRGWTRDRVEIRRRRGRHFQWPNAMRDSGSELHFIVQGSECRRKQGRNGVLAVSR